MKQYAVNETYPGIYGVSTYIDGKLKSFATS